jgi:putative copper export protein
LSLDGPTWLLFAVKAAFTVFALLAIGFGLHAALGISPAGRRESIRAAAAAGAALGLMLARMALLNAQLGGGFVSAFDLSFFAWTWRALGPAALATALGCASALAAFAIASRRLAGASAILLASGFALTGHAAAMEQAGLASAAVGMHVLIAGFWIAAPVTLYPAAALTDADLLSRLRRFSRYAALLVPLLFVLGLWLAWVLAGGPRQMLSTLYGGLLLAKLAAAAMALALGAANQRFVTALIGSNPARGRSWLRLTLRLEAVLFTVAVIAISAATTLTGPPTDA